MGAAAMGVGRAELCSRLFPPVATKAEVPASLRERFRRALERQENLFYMPPAVNQAKKNLLMGGNPDKVTLNGRMNRLAVTVVLSTRFKDIKATATLLIDLLQSAGDIPPLLTAETVPASRRAITRSQTKSKNPFTDALVSEWRDKILMARVQKVIDENKNIYKPSGRNPGGTLRSDKECRGKKRKAGPTTAGQGEPASKKTKTGKRDELVDVEEEDCVEDDAVSSSTALLSSSPGSTTSTASTGQSATSTPSTHSTPHVTVSDGVSRTVRPTASGSLGSGTSAKVAHDSLDSQPLVTPTAASYSSPASRLLASVPTRSSAMPLQSSKPSSAAASPMLAGFPAPARATHTPVLTAPSAASAPLAKVPVAAPLAQQKLPVAKRPIAPLPLRGSGLSKPAKSSRPLTIRRALD